jgi:integrase
LADDYLAQELEDAAINGKAEKWTDKVKANLTLLREIVGKDTLAGALDYQLCMTVRSTLARVPTNRTKVYRKLSLEKAIERAKADGKPVLSSVTQSQYLDTLKGVLELAALKRLIPNNPAQSLRPLKRDDTKPSEKRLAFTLDQIKGFFTSNFYRSCAPGALTSYTKHDRHWRFWLPLICLYMGARPNEVCQMLNTDVRQTPQGIWYVDVAASDDDDDAAPNKTVKTAASRRRIPIHPELIAIGLIDFATASQKSKPGARLFPTLKADKYGNLASYALRRFRESFLPAVITVQERQTFYSFRHSFRDALRRSKAPPDALQALGGWDQGSLTSDSYGDKFDPDYQIQFLEKVSYPGLDLAFLRSSQSASKTAQPIAEATT